MNETQTPAANQQKSSTGTTIGRWFLDKVAGALVIALIVYCVSLAASVTREDLIHFLGGASKKDLASYVRYDDAMYITKVSGNYDGRVIVNNPNNGTEDYVKLWGPEQVNHPEYSKFAIRQWKSQ